ncbi:UDP-glucuronosyl/UDP-glucosyltransferase [Trema orientale]|uniref:UDP-glucuronosyl/UDP-glucosyltransferase n=1 Tax=Trema orientale TaxID=63057 RepID=A0A2P5EXT8_TREOI|nr:UDP-glucuronosyl/UDP-glucosyltransferase [Trema orientale]
MESPHLQHRQHENHSQCLSSPSSSVAVVIVPYPAQSHLNQLLQFALVVSSYDIPVHYVGIALHTARVKSRTSNPLHNLTKICFHDFPTPPLPFCPPNSSGHQTKFPEHSVFCFEATTHLRQPVAALLRSLSLTT